MDESCSWTSEVGSAARPRRVVRVWNRIDRGGAVSFFACTGSSSKAVQFDASSSSVGSALMSSSKTSTIANLDSSVRSTAFPFMLSFEASGPPKLKTVIVHNSFRTFSSIPACLHRLIKAPRACIITSRIRSPLLIPSERGWRSEERGKKA